MASKKALLGSTQVKVENVSGFDKSGFNAFTAPLGAIVPMRKQLLLPGHFSLRVKLSAQLPPLAADSFLRTHLKVEAFVVPMRLCYGGFMSWFSGEPVSSDFSGTPSSTLTHAQLPRIKAQGTYADSGGVTHTLNQGLFNTYFGPHSLMDYFGVKYYIGSGGAVVPPGWANQTSTYMHSYFNAFPFLAYQLCYHHWYRNKLVQRPLFAQPSIDSGGSGFGASACPFISSTFIRDFDADFTRSSDASFASTNIALMNGHLLQLRYRNYGFDYFTTSLPSAQDGSPMTVDTSAGNFTISALRLANSLQHFAEVNQVAGPDYVQTCRARYGKAPSNQVAQRPILVGSADFPMFTAGVEQASGTVQSGTGNPFAGMAARYGRAHAEGSDFVCEVDVDEPSYLMLMCSIVPEANYATGVSHDMKIFTAAGSIVDLPNSQLELAGLEPVLSSEVWKDDSGSANPLVFGYQPRYMWHKAGQQNEVHGLFREGASLQAFIPQRYFATNLSQVTLSSNFLEVKPTDLDNVTAVSGAISQYGVMIDSAIELYVSEPLGEGALPSLVDPAAEHGHSVYVKRGGISVND